MLESWKDGTLVVEKQVLILFKTLVIKLLIFCVPAFIFQIWYKISTSLIFANKRSPEKKRLSP